MNQGPRNPRRGPIQFPLNWKSEAASSRRSMSAIGCKADVTFCGANVRFCADLGISEMQRLNIAIPVHIQIGSQVASYPLGKLFSCEYRCIRFGPGRGMAKHPGETFRRNSFERAVAFTGPLSTHFDPKPLMKRSPSQAKKSQTELDS